MNETWGWHTMAFYSLSYLFQFDTYIHCSFFGYSVGGDTGNIENAFFIYWIVEILFITIKFFSVNTLAKCFHHNPANVLPISTDSIPGCCDSYVDRLRSV